MYNQSSLGKLMKFLNSCRFLAATVGESRRGKTASLVQISKDSLRHLGRFTESERRLVDSEIFAYAEILIQRQESIETEIFRPFAAEDVYISEKDARYLRELDRWYWKFLARLESQVLVRRKGTQRAGSRNGSQTCCTHVMAIYESDATTRWLLGLLPKFDRALRAVRNQLSRIVSTWAYAQSRRWNNSNFEFCAA